MNIQRQGEEHVDAELQTNIVVAKTPVVEYEIYYKHFANRLWRIKQCVFCLGLGGYICICASDHDMAKRNKLLRLYYN